MSAQSNARFETLAQGLADGLAIIAAAKVAGYSPKDSNFYKLAKKPNFIARVEALRLRAQRGGSADLGPVIDALMAGAEAAVALGTGSGMSAAARMLAEAGRLKLKLPKASRGRLSAAGELTDEEWAAAYGPAS